MATTTTLRPSATYQTFGSVSLTGGATYHAVTSDNSDASFATVPPDSYFTVSVPAHTPAAGSQRHAVRVRGRMKAVSGSPTGNLFLAVDQDKAGNAYGYTSHPALGTTIIDFVGSWMSFPTHAGMRGTGAVTFFVGTDRANTATLGNRQIMELYVDVDTRVPPSFTPVVRDSSGANKNGGIITDGRVAVLTHSGVSYDGLPSRSWSVVVKDPLGTTVATYSGTGDLPATLTTGVLPNGAYTATWTVSSTIRGQDAFSTTTSVSFTMNPASGYSIPPPANPTAVPQSFGYLLSWEDPGISSLVDVDTVYVEIRRTSCKGSETIGTVQGLSGSFYDVTAPIDDDHPCSESTCDLRYEFRYWAAMTSVFVTPGTVPAGFAIGWDSANGTPGAGWTLMTNVSEKYLKGVIPAQAATLGGAPDHGHYGPDHTHTVNAHTHNPSSASTSVWPQDEDFTTKHGEITDGRWLVNHSHPMNVSNPGGGQVSSEVSQASSAAVNNPSYRKLRWYVSDGSPGSIPVNAYCLSGQESIAGWTQVHMPDNAARLLRATQGAMGDGGNRYALSHTFPSHTHSTTGTHTHSGDTDANPFTMGSNSFDQLGNGTVSGTKYVEMALHGHTLTLNGSALGNVTGAASTTTDTTTEAHPPWYALTLIKRTAAADPISLRVIGISTLTGAVSNTEDCNGANGTPNLVGKFALLAESARLAGSTGGAVNHFHTVGNHTATLGSHSHTTSISTFANFAELKQRRTGTPQQVAVPQNHAHTGGYNPATPTATASGAGNTATSAHEPEFIGVRFLRIKATGDTPLPTRVQVQSDWVAVFVPRLTNPSVERGASRLAVPARAQDPTDRLTSELWVWSDDSWDDGRQTTVDQAVGGGNPQVGVQPYNRDRSVSFPATPPALGWLRDYLQEEKAPLLHYTPYGQPGGWYVVTDASVSSPKVRRRREVSLSLRSVPAPPIPDPVV